VVQITVRRLDHCRSNPTVCLGGNRLTVSEVGEGKEARRVSWEGFVVLLQNLLEYPQWIVTRFHPQRAQGDDALGGVIEATHGRFRVHRACDVENIAIRPLPGERK